MKWDPAKKFAFIFLATYVFLYSMSYQFVLSFLFDKLWQKVVPWVGANVLNLSKEITIFTNGSGDTTYNYVSLLVFVAIAVVVATLVVVINTKRLNYNQLFHWFIILVRYYLIFQMITYGLAKIYYMQFRTPSFDRLIEMFGDASPMGLLWTFMGYSKGYTMFTGFGEFFGGVFLLFRKTRTLGALVVFAIMSNVMALNYFYDVPVKILSTHLVLLSIILIAIDGKRLINVFILNKSTEPINIPPNFQHKPLEKWSNVGKWVVVVAAIGFMLFQTQNLKNRYIKPPEEIPFYGLYEVSNFIQNSDTLAAIISDSTRWKYIAVESQNRATIYAMNHKKARVNLAIDSVTQSLVLSQRGVDEPLGTLSYHYSSDSTISFIGLYQGDSLNVSAEIKSKKDFLLINRGFRWINEYPFNR